MTPAKRAECLDVIVDRAGHLSRLVEDLLLASRMSATEGASPVQVELATDDLAALTRRACGDFGTEGERVSVLLPEGPVPVSCDPVRVIQVLTNLVGNALKYSTPGTPVRVRLVVRDGTAQVEVQDSGRGIPADQLERVFDKFHRVEDPMRMTTSGTGLGLYIARQLATAMGGELGCTSTLNVGSVFRFGLPLAVPGQRAPGQTDGALPPAPPAPRRGFVRPEGLTTPDGAPARPGRNTPPWAVPPPRPPVADAPHASEPLG
jgi:signal transduction histidine kinase